MNNYEFMKANPNPTIAANSITLHINATPSKPYHGVYRMCFPISTVAMQRMQKLFLLFIPLSLYQCPSYGFVTPSFDPEFKTALSANISRKSNKRTQFEKLIPMEYEQSLLHRGYRHIIGSDEVGRGSIAGPVLAVSCCIFPIEGEEGGLINDVTDSKLLSPHQRESIYEEIIHNRYKQHKFAISQRSPEQIDETNIQKATMECFQESIQKLITDQKLPLDETYAIVDGTSTPKLVNGPTPIPCRPLVSADKYIYTVSIASIIAKVIRDEIMVEASKIYPEYCFDINKGYTSREHIEAIHKYGPSPLHRMSFKALQHR